MEVARIHFGWFVREKRLERGWTLRKLSDESGVTATRLVAIEKMPEPQIQQTTFSRIASALGMKSDELEREWRQTEVREPKLRKASYSPGNGEARQQVTVRLGLKQFDRIQTIAKLRALSVQDAIAALIVEGLTVDDSQKRSGVAFDKAGTLMSSSSPLPDPVHESKSVRRKPQAQRPKRRKSGASQVEHQH